MQNNPYSWIESSLSTIHKANWYRSVKTIESIPGAIIKLEGKKLINFASNDYLGLAGDERLIAAAIQATKEFGSGSTGSRLLTGHREIHQELEREIAKLKQTESALVFSSGYLANIGVISSVVSQRDLILSDEYNHSSLKNGAILSGAKIIEYSHNNIEYLKNKLEQKRENYRRSLIITDSVFSMDGDLCKLPLLLDLAEKYNSMLLVDEAHATGVFGINGGGCVEHFNCTGKQLIQIGTLSKALGSLGGYVAGSKNLIEFLRNRTPTWIYTTGLTPADTAAALTAIKIIKKEPERRMKLWQNLEIFINLLETESQLLHKGKKTSNYESPIICFPLKNAVEALKVGEKLKQEGIFAPAIRPPTVNTSRIRISLMSTHETSHLQQLIAALINLSQ
ncbi:8-amino-7-oxononanoate synthase [Trichodesmium erythraeum IMS101]|uniref:Putative 8-amino-7-oxononanoate synthase n=1 Tax=Trichodesmium erythraeum (strain IMS101) TaxID=203124 RepID=BIOF_TRIEI|nr:RecName: Full=Putative 8-amino-7-oxononanoate synthase; Short=AONS; AltName: Full=7-keto-8-amino-pelargonic acid synthase; Short=7-KAP synthase; AltName: Full=8-amino-7-ketopelargonate synthase [Trichodesmium erythraeum IMS101]MBS9771010.1 8-amino-7-oxononanoate synthase [Trichodesmium erythraeum GBRTRLIN201]MDE5093182.1 8-amino-7-oxononanoate synthase [Trichodesmium sp. St11_bin5]